MAQSPRYLVFDYLWVGKVLTKVAEGNLDSLFLVMMNSSFAYSLYNSHVLELCSIIAIFLRKKNSLARKNCEFPFNMKKETAFLRILA